METGANGQIGVSALRAAVEAPNFASEAVITLLQVLSLYQKVFFFTRPLITEGLSLILVLEKKCHNQYKNFLIAYEVSHYSASNTPPKFHIIFIVF